MFATIHARTNDGWCTHCDIARVSHGKCTLCELCARLSSLMFAALLGASVGIAIQVYLWDTYIIYYYNTSSTRTRRGGSCLRDIYKTFLIYRTCMRRAPARPVRACTLRKWCPLSHVTFEAPLRTSHSTLHTCHCTLRTSHSTLHTSQSTLHT